MQLTKELYHQIATICSQVTIGIVGDNIYVCHSFNPSTGMGANSVDFCSIQGINITEFFTMNPIQISLHNQNEFLARFTKYIEGMPILNIKFNRNTEYFIFS